MYYLFLNSFFLKLSIIGSDIIIAINNNSQYIWMPVCQGTMANAFPVLSLIVVISIVRWCRRGEETGLERVGETFIGTPWVTEVHIPNLWYMSSHLCASKRIFKAVSRCELNTNSPWLASPKTVMAGDLIWPVAWAGAWAAGPEHTLQDADEMASVKQIPGVLPHSKPIVLCPWFFLPVHIQPQ